jgi:hypothetical protein
MNKADFDRKYKAVKGHMLNRVIVVTIVDGEEVAHQVEDVYWDDKNNALVILTD